MEIKIGADPEFFLKDKETGNFVSAYGLIPGTKEEPHKVENGAIQVDGMAVEFNIDPASDSTKFVKNITSVITQLRKIIPERYSFEFVPVATFGKEYIEAQPKEARILGCDPDFNAWEDGAPNPIPDASASFRTASGHIHIGWGEDIPVQDAEHLEACHMMVKQLDIMLGVASIAWDNDPIRRQLYGKAGAYRPKSYGVEYRVLSNVWLTDPSYMKYVFDTTKFAFERLMNGVGVYSIHDFYVRKLREVINSSNVNGAYNAWSNDGYYSPIIYSMFQKNLGKLNKDDGILIIEDDEDDDVDIFDDDFDNIVPAGAV